MTSYSFTDIPETIGNGKTIASAKNGSVYTDGGNLYVKTTEKQVIYKYNGAPVGWYQTNLKTLEDIYLGKGACPSVNFEGLTIEDETIWSAIVLPKEEKTKKEN